MTSADEKEKAKLLPLADVSDVLRSFKDIGPRKTVASTSISRGPKELRLNKQVLLEALSSWVLFHPEDAVLIDDLKVHVDLFKRRGRFGKRTLTVAWRGRGKSAKDLRPILQVPITLYAEKLDISPPDRTQAHEGRRTRSEHTLNVEFLPDGRIIIDCSKLSTDAYDSSEED